MGTHLGGFESTQIFGSGQDVLGSTKHLKHWRADLERLLSQGIATVRYSAPWHRIESQPGVYDWSWFDGPMEFMRTHGMQPILDPLHYTSFPTWVAGGFENPGFPNFYVQFLKQLATRYSWATTYTLFNEPLATTLFCSDTGMWFPHLACDRSFVRMVLQAGQAICLGGSLLKDLVGAQFVHIECCEHHRASDGWSSNWARFANARRFLVTDLILGRINRNHELYPYLIRNGATQRELAWFGDHPARIDVLGLGYYLHSEMDWRRSGDVMEAQPVAQKPRGFAAVAQDYVARYGRPVMLAATNIVGSVSERIAWLKLMEQECEALGGTGVNVRGFCWYPSIDSTDWSNGCTRYTGKIDPQGIWTLRERTFERVGTELSDLYGRLAKGEITPAQIPDSGLERDLRQRVSRYEWQSYSHLLPEIEQIPA